MTRNGSTTTGEAPGGQELTTPQAGPPLLGALFDHIGDALIVVDGGGIVREANEAAGVLFRADLSALIGLDVARLLPLSAPLLAFQSTPDRRGPLQLEVTLGGLDGSSLKAALTAVTLEGGRAALLFRATEEEPGRAGRKGEPHLGGITTDLILENSSDVFLVFGEGGSVRYVSPPGERYNIGENIANLEGFLGVMHPRDVGAANGALLAVRGDAGRHGGKPARASVTVRFRVDGAWRWFELHLICNEVGAGGPSLLVQAREVDEQVQATMALRENEALFRTLFDKSHEGVALIGRDRRLLRLGGTAAGLLGLSLAELTDGDGLEEMHPNDREALAEALDLIEARAGASEPVRFRFRSRGGEYQQFEGTITNLLHEQNLRAFLLNFRECLEPVEALGTIQNLNEELTRRLAHLQSLRRIDMAINTSDDLHLVLDIFLVQVMHDLGVDAMSVLLHEQGMQALRPLLGRGFSGDLKTRSWGRVGEGLAGRAAQEQRLVFIPNLALEETKGAAVPAEQQDEYQSYMAVPMFAKQQLQGVIELYFKSLVEPSDEWLEFLETYADQGAIAIENSQLLRSLEKSNQELQRAYDRTIEGWADALDLKDEETAGHSKRVTEMTVRLARRLGVPDEEIVHIHRGALLHDIGKMGIPDQILLKHGPLTTEEFDIMRQHPIYAYDLLSPIEFLRPALHIPLSHHEKWDGSGYPHGLKGEQIPLAARIFAVVDVFDALTSDRPYRKAWSIEEARAYLREETGTHFDPKVVDAYFEMIDSELSG